jgi:hypothetical protein
MAGARGGGLIGAVVDRLIPGDEHWPPGGSTAAVRFVEQAVADGGEQGAAVAAVLQGVSGLAARRGGLFAWLPEPVRDAVLGDVEAQPGWSSGFRMLYELACEGYYTDPLVEAVIRERTGFDAARPLTGVPLEPFDERLLDRVRGLAPSYRPVPR